MVDKHSAYASLITNRKACTLCQSLENPARVLGGQYDSKQIGPWTLWQGNLDAEIMIVGQDWGDVHYFTTHAGHEAARNPTNETLVKLLASIGIIVAPPSPQDNGGGVLFFTNAILCLKREELQAAVQPDWFQNCGRHFLKPTIDVVRPKILVTLGEGVYRVMCDLYDLPRKKFSNAAAESFRLNDTLVYFPMYHCGRRMLNTHRPWEQQLKDWNRVRAVLNNAA